MSDIQWTSEQRRLGDLIPRERNPVTITEHDKAHLKMSVEKFGLALPLICQPDGNLIDGHQRQQALFLSDQFGADATVDVRVPSRPLTEEEVAELAVRLRRNVGTFDWDILMEDFTVDQLTDWGFLEDELGTWKAKKHKPEAVKPELEISPELFERHDYVVLFVDNELDWQVLCEELDIKQMQGGKVGNKTIIQKGIGRVVPASRFFDALATARGETHDEA